MMQEGAQHGNAAAKASANSFAALANEEPEETVETEKEMLMKTPEKEGVTEEDPSKETEPHLPPLGKTQEAADAKKGTRRGRTCAQSWRSKCCG
jgi:hypothetical protein